MTIPNYLYDRSITNVFDDYIHQDCDSFHEILDIDKDELLARSINLLGNDTYELLMDSDVLRALSRCIISRKSESAIEVIEKIKSVLFSKLIPLLDKAYDERILSTKHYYGQVA